MATGRIGVTPTLRTRWSKQPSAGTTSLSGLDDNSVSLVYDVGYEAVYRNGVLLSRGNDYTATSGTSITLINATLTGDVIEVLANQLVPLTDAISKGQFTAKGALLSATAASTPGVLPVGTNGQYLSADSTASTGLAWASVSAGANWSLLNAGGTALTGAATITISGISAKDKIMILFKSASTASDYPDIKVRFNTDSGNNYYTFGGLISVGSTYAVGNFYAETGSANNGALVGFIGTPSSSSLSGYLLATGCNASGSKMYQASSGPSHGGGSAGSSMAFVGGYYDSSSTISSVSMFSTSGSFDAGTVYVYTSA